MSESLNAARKRLRVWADDMKLSNQLGTPYYANPGELKADLRLLLDAAGPGREMLARVCWPRLLDQAPLTLDERQVIGELWQIVVSEDDAITQDARARCWDEAIQEAVRRVC